MSIGETLETNGEFYITGPDNVLDFKVSEAGGKAELLNDSSVLSSGEFGIILTLGTGDDHLTTGKDECGGLWITNTHDDSGKSLWIVLCIPCVESNGL